MILETRLVPWPDEAACAAMATALAQRPAVRRAVVELDGPLGAGKTTFARHLLRALGVLGRIKSPSYAIVEPHHVPASPAGGDALDIWHFDFYRFTDPREWEDAGLRDLFAQAGLKLIEWPEHARAWLPAPDLRLHLSLHDDGSRTVRCEALSPLGLELLP